MKIWYRLLLVLFSFLSLSMSSSAECPSFVPDPLVVEVGVWGKPPALVDVKWPESEEGDEFYFYADSVQVEFREAGVAGKLIYQRWFERDELMWSDKNFYRLYVPTDDESYEYGHFYKYYLLGSGPGRLRYFPAGDYVVRWRARYMDYCEYPYVEKMTDWVETPFSIMSIQSLAFTVYGPGVIEEQDDLEFSWTNNFAASSYKVEIRQGKKVVRKATVLGGFGPSGQIKSKWPGLEESRIAGGSYFDLPAYNRELPNGTGYVFMVSGYSPIAKKWSGWSDFSFEMNRGTPTLPSLELSQNDYDGYFDRSLRPYFKTDYNGQTPLWTYFDIQRKNPAGKLSVVRRLWVSRYKHAFGYLGGTNKFWLGFIGGNGGSWNSQIWQKDLPPGEYVWRVRAYNGPGSEQSAWTPYQTNSVLAPGVLAKPDASKILVDQNDWSLSIYWDAVPNAYAYRYEVRRNGKIVSKSKVLDDPDKAFYLIATQGVLRAENLYVKRLPEADGYQIRVQAINDANPAGKTSEWSDWSAPFSLIPASISGRVTDSNGKGIQGVFVAAGFPVSEELYNSWSGWWNWRFGSDDDVVYWAGMAAYTDKNGNYKINYLKPGTYKVRFEGGDYESQVWQSVAGLSFADGADVVVGESQSVTGINAILVPWQ